MEVLQAIKERRSVRKQKSDAVSEEELNTILEAGRWAPSWANTQCWQFIVVRDPETKGKLADTAGSRNPAFDAIKNGPLTIVICGEKGKAGYYKGEPATNKGDWLMFDTGLATQNMMLAAHALGLGSVPVGLFDAQKAGEILGVPQNVDVVAMLPLGYPAEEAKAPRRKELSELVSYDRYGNREVSWR